MIYNTRGPGVWTQYKTTSRSAVLLVDVCIFRHFSVMFWCEVFPVSIDYDHSAEWKPNWRTFTQSPCSLYLIFLHSYYFDSLWPSAFAFGSKLQRVGLWLPYPSGKGRIQKTPATFSDPCDQWISVRFCDSHWSLVQLPTSAAVLDLPAPSGNRTPPWPVLREATWRSKISFHVHPWKIDLFFWLADIMSSREKPVFLLPIGSLRTNLKDLEASCGIGQKNCVRAGQQRLWRCQRQPSRSSKKKQRAKLEIVVSPSVRYRAGSWS